MGRGFQKYGQNGFQDLFEEGVRSIKFVSCWAITDSHLPDCSADRAALLWCSCKSRVVVSSLPYLKQKLRDSSGGMISAADLGAGVLLRTRGIAIAISPF